MQLQNKTTILLTSISSGLEYYDFIIYGLMASYLSKLFFPASDPSLELVKAMSIFALGYFCRPLGGIIAGMIADKYGRKKKLSLLLS